jgi:transcription elongation factor Elf1
MTEYTCPKCNSKNIVFKPTGSIVLKGTGTKIVNMLDELHCKDCGVVSEAPKEFLWEKTLSFFK